MHQRTIAIDLAKSVFELSVVNRAGKSLDRKRLRRGAFIEYMAVQAPCAVVMEACRAAHHWGRTFRTQGHEVRLLPPSHVRHFRLGNKTDRSDVAALVDAMRSPQIKAVAVKTVTQQNIQHVHRMRELWQKNRVAQINALRGMLTEYGLEFPLGPEVFLKQVHAAIAQEAQVAMLLPLLREMLQDIATLSERIVLAERLLKEVTKGDEDLKRIQGIPGFGPLNSTSLMAAAGDPSLFANGRALANWLGLTPAEHSSGDKRRLGRITREGNKRLRSLIVHGARAVLGHARLWAVKTPTALSPLQRWAINLAERRGFNKATIALANKLVRIAWVVWAKQVPYSSTPAAVV